MCAERLQDEGPRVEPARRPPLVVRQCDFLPGRVRPIKPRAGVRLVAPAGRYRDRESGLQVEDRAKLPAADEPAHDSAAIQEPSPATERQFIQQRTHRTVRHVETRQPALGRQVVAVLREKGVAVMSADSAAVINRLRPGVADDERRALAVALLQLRAEAVVVRFGAAVHIPVCG